MRFQITQGWPIGQFLLPPATVIDLGDKEDHELTEYEKLAKGRIQPIDICALDADCAIAMMRFYPWSHDKLRRDLSDFEEAILQQLLSLNERTLERLWARGKG